jgi:hypothetical protein
MPRVSGFRAGPVERMEQAVTEPSGVRRSRIIWVLIAPVRPDIMRSPHHAKSRPTVSSSLGLCIIAGSASSAYCEEPQYAEFERSLIRERTQAGQMRYKQDFENGRVGKTVYSRSGRNMPPHRPQKVFDREEVFRLRCQGRSYRQIAKSLGLGLGTVVRTLQALAKSS